MKKQNKYLFKNNFNYIENIILYIWKLNKAFF
jgi:hypothetical protein